MLKTSPYSLLRKQPLNSVSAQRMPPHATHIRITQYEKTTVRESFRDRVTNYHTPARKQSKSLLKAAEIPQNPSPRSRKSQKFFALGDKSSQASYRKRIRVATLPSIFHGVFCCWRRTDSVAQLYTTAPTPGLSLSISFPNWPQPATVWRP
jgi:hypothetical protein